jgi:hypothetical protein
MCDTMWITEDRNSELGCYVSMNREPGATASLETVHECGGNDWTCPLGVVLELETVDAAEAAFIETYGR